MDQVELSMLVDHKLRPMSLVIDLIDLVAKHKSGELRCPATALIICLVSLV